jgi:hypothetical protein
MNTLRYLLVLLIAGVEASVILALGAIMNGSSSVAPISLGIGMALLAAAVVVSRISLDYARARFHKVRPPLPFSILLAAAGVAALAVGGYSTIDAIGHGLAHATLRVATGVWFLSLGSGVFLGCYHLWRDAESADRQP